MATLCLSSSSSVKISTFIHSFPANANLIKSTSFFPQKKTIIQKEDTESLKLELLEAIAPLDRGAEATPEDQILVDQDLIAVLKLDKLNCAVGVEVEVEVEVGGVGGGIAGCIEKLFGSYFAAGALPATEVKLIEWKSGAFVYNISIDYANEGLVCDKALVRLLLWQRPKFLRPNGKIYQAINADTLRAQNIETAIFQSDTHKSRGSGRGQLEITYLDEELRISRGNQGNLFILRMADPSYRVPV
ncbi:hypothetical protein RND71_000515 [Anisodus tanguticus]|uniref:Plastid lipid-associated protein/fibrillin conserved domain-containing protein n=1 Tax=Anisodus tanguticus TaxID=243964 RepID=A0AAE1VQ35_9SOLA|nr:hypothetical protein RND71_000515 [Anisodus tanguticus]